MQTVKDLVIDYITKCTVTADRVAEIIGTAISSMSNYEVTGVLVPVTRQTRYDIDDVNKFLADHNYDEAQLFKRIKTISDRAVPNILEELSVPDDIKVAKLSAYVSLLEYELEQLRQQLREKE